ncbi:MSHA biogenesis protein MshI [Vibrio profundum]|uniref:MSHA biogenesis protein MshI n=1 Tax=Vibrio profundum TaxID=2910247 RepID=UPI003D0A96CA
MKLPSLIPTFSVKSSTSLHLYVVVQPHALYFSSAQTIPGVPEHVMLAGIDWLELLIDVVEKVTTSLHVDIVLHSELYQDFQIDKPNLPKEDWPTALPFLVKDLTSDSVSDLVADAFELPNSNKINAYLLSKSLLLKISEQLSSLGHQLKKVMIEDDVWGIVPGNSQPFWLLQRSPQGNYRISAYVEKKCIFHRTIRGVSAPLSGEGTSGLALDGAALELQRSVDYLSSQLKGAALHHLKVCCDGESDQELAKALDERISVKASPLLERSEESGHLLALHVSEAPATSINLYPEHLQPKIEYLTLKNILISWLVMAVVVGASAGVFHFLVAQNQDKIASIKLNENALSQQLKVLKTELKKHQPSPEKVAAVARLRMEIKAKRSSLAAVDEYDKSQQIGYSGVMKALAEIGRDDISLSSISMDQRTFDILGRARNAKSIPSWINQFKSELNLVGRTFEKLKITRSDNNLVTFELKSKKGTH